MAFRDDYPQDPPPIGDDWSKPLDRRPHDSLEEVRTALRELSGLLAGLSRQDIELHDGRRINLLLADSGFGVGSGGLWGIEIVEASSGSLRIVNPGTIIKDFGDVSAELSIGSIDGDFSASAGKKLWIEITGDAENPVAELVCGDDWNDRPSPVETSGSGDAAAFVAYRYFLWEFLGEATADTDVPINGNLFGKKLVDNTHFVRTGTTFQKPGGNQPFWTHLLLPYHRAITS